MIKIAALNDEYKSKLDEFEKTAWNSANTEHYGNTTVVDFTEENLTLLAFNDGSIIGYITYSFKMGVCKIHSLIVDDSMRQQGIGSQLLTAVETHSKERGIHKLTLSTGADWSERKFYENHGYVIIVELKNHYAGADFVLMEKIVSRD